MHEYSLADNILKTCIASANQYNAKIIKEVHLELGDFALIVEHMLEECFRIASSGSIASEAKLIMKRTPGVLKCNDCGKSSEIWFEEEKKKEEEDSKKSLEIYEEGIAKASGVSGYKNLGINLFQCKHCGSKNTELAGGKEIKIKNIKVTD
jgi:hydrogenase nickel insertion protein HypA